MVTTTRLIEAGELERLREPWEALYALQYTQGMTSRAPIDGFDRWRDAIEPLLGRFAVVAVAEHAGTLAGFVAGRVRTAVPHLGGEPMGYVSEVFTRADLRGQGVGAHLLDMVVDWFRQQGISRIELHVAAGNVDGLRFYERRGWKAEMLQLVLDE